MNPPWDCNLNIVCQEELSSGIIPYLDNHLNDLSPPQDLLKWMLIEFFSYGSCYTYEKTCLKICKFITITFAYGNCYVCKIIMLIMFLLTNYAYKKFIMPQTFIIDCWVGKHCVTITICITASLCGIIFVLLSKPYMGGKWAGWRVI